MVDILQTLKLDKPEKGPNFNAQSGRRCRALLNDNITDMKKNQHVVPHGDQWAVKGEGNGKATVITDTQSEAIDRGRSIAQNNQSELFIHNRQGQIRERNTYGNDPNPPKG